MIDKILPAVITVGGMGLMFGLLLAYASKKFAVKVDERVPKIIDVLPGANCGGCGYAGCSAFANAVVEGKAKVNGCSVGGEKCASAIAEIMGVESEKTEKMVARVRCVGTNDKAKKKYEYYGIDDCVAASKLGGGDKACAYGCLGLGTCVKACPFGGIEIINGVANINDEVCMGCGKCVDACPKNIIELVPVSQKAWVMCKSKDRGKDVISVCSSGCIGCKLCEKACKFDAIHVIDNIPVIDYDKCVNCLQCAAKCPKGVIKGKKKTE